MFDLVREALKASLGEDDGTQQVSFKLEIAASSHNILSKTQKLLKIVEISEIYV
jgi:hypothetical protein